MNRLLFSIALPLFLVEFSCSYIESVAANVVGGAEDVPVVRSQRFNPQVVFKCGYRNRYMNKDGEWSTDKDSHATCLKGKLDILKYCRKVYPDLAITNIVESSHTYDISDWCKAEGQPCKWSFWVKPYKCIVGEFESEALLVPEGCHFGHVDDRSTCKDFDHWNRTAQLECAKRLDVTKVQSFAVLEPCGLDMFSGVEYVCCPRSGVKKTVDLQVKVKLEPEKNVSAEEDESDEDEDDEEIEKIEATSSTTTTKAAKKLTKVPATTPASKAKVANNAEVDEDDDDSDSDEDEENTVDDDKNFDEQDVYFRIADPDNEHDRYREALERLEAKHRNKVAKVMKEWADLETRYNEMATKDPHHAQQFRSEMTTRFQRTVAALEEENKDERRQVEDVHQQRVNAGLNERKRQTIKTYRDTLSAAKPLPQKVLRALQSYIRAEEKDRVHSLNRYRHLLKTDPEEASDMKTELLRKLRDVDLRINGTIDMLKQFPDVETKVKPAAPDGLVQFWKDFRADNTPDGDSKEMSTLDVTKNDKLLEMYKKQYQAEYRQKKVLNLNKVAVDEVVPEKAPMKKTTIGKIIVETSTPVAPTTTKLPVIVFDPIIETESESETESVRRIVDEISAKSRDSFSLKDTLHHNEAFEDEFATVPGSRHYGYIVFGLAGVALLVAMIFGVVLLRGRYSARRQGFIEVDACTPEERHVAAMQVNGYENPTYKYFDADKA